MKIKHIILMALVLGILSFCEGCRQGSDSEEKVKISEAFILSEPLADASENPETDDSVAETEFPDTVLVEDIPASPAGIMNEFDGDFTENEIETDKEAPLSEDGFEISDSVSDVWEYRFPFGYGEENEGELDP